MGRPPRGRGDGAPGGEPGGRGGGGMPGHAEVDCDLWEDRCAPSVKYSFSQQQTKGQDVVFVQEGLTRREDGPTWSVYCACDGHAGVAAARFVRDRLWEALGPLLPTRRMPLYKTDGELVRPGQGNSAIGTQTHSTRSPCGIRSTSCTRSSKRRQLYREHLLLQLCQ
ncbi:unnamed protein product [Ostreobium quekettii]|uniref:PPM-type phosphatase domain-containing protein n=1 Tax=Ostreobium quekettii TaxID=121088 RepID=A0A8S1J670_9CHLO|nr:unnamed protein product [Ostreobium quekettii]